MTMIPVASIIKNKLVEAVILTRRAIDMTFSSVGSEPNPDVFLKVS